MKSYELIGSLKLMADVEELLYSEIKNPVPLRGSSFDKSTLTCQADYRSALLIELWSGWACVIELNLNSRLKSENSVLQIANKGRKAIKLLYVNVFCHIFDLAH